MEFLPYIITLLAAVISLAAALITVLYDRKRLKDGVKNTSDVLELELKQKEIENKIQLEQQKLELERKKQEAREKWKKFDAGLRLLDLISNLEDAE